jgi:ATP-binding cassette subfamily B protein
MSEISQIEKKRFDKILKHVAFYLSKKRKKQIILIFCLSILSSLAESISVAILVPFISFFLESGDFYLKHLVDNFLTFFDVKEENILIVIFIAFISTILFSAYIKLKFIKLSNSLSLDIKSDFRIKIFNFLINQKYSYYFKHGTTDVMSSLAQKSQSFAVMIFASINILNSLLISFAIITILLINEAVYTSIIIFTVIIFFLIIFKIKSAIVLRKGQRANDNQNFIIDTFENAIGYLQEIIVYNLKPFFSKTLTSASKTEVRSISDIKTISMVPKIYLESFIIIFGLSFVYFSDFTSKTAESNIAYLAILAYGFQKCFPLINNIYHLSINFRQATPNVLEFLNILDRDKKQVLISEEIKNKLKFEKQIKIENLSFRYNPKDKNILDDFNLVINAGEKIALKGKTGSGKSTLANIISGLLDEFNGKLYVDNVEINNSNVKSWQKNISIVPQTIFLNNASIAENIAIGLKPSEIDFDKVSRSAKFAKIDKYIEKLPNKFNELVGERGIRLSGGQKQRIGIARAIFRNSSLIVLDEPTNALDLATEKEVIKELTKQNNLTILMITHSDKYSEYFDKIVDLDTIQKN